MAQFLLVLAAVLLLVASFIERPNPAPYPFLPHLGWFGLFLYVLVAALGAFGVGR
jgi:hypothetical protein